MYNNFFAFDPMAEKRRMIQMQKKEIMQYSVKIGACILIFLVSPYIIGFLLGVFNLFPFYEKNLAFQYSIEIAMTVFSLFIPFFVVYKISNRETKTVIENSFEKPKSALLTIPAIFFGLMLCFAGDYISYFISVIFEAAGITLTTTPDQTIPTSGVELFLFAFSTIVPPAIIEEFTLRAVTMQPLRKYGEAFAIVSTAIVFGLMHRNAVQGIFAFVAGLAFGFIAVSTNSVWPSVIIHALNNGFAVLSNVLNEINPDLANSVYSFTVTMVFLLGIISAIPFFKSRHRISVKSQKTLLSAQDKTQAFFITVPMVLAMAAMIFYTVFGDL